MPRRKPSPSRTTVDQAIATFLEDERERLSPRTWSRYKHVIDLFRIYLENFPAREDGADRPDPPSASSSCQMLPALAEEFLTSFLPHKLSFSAARLVAAQRVMRRLVAAVEPPPGLKPRGRTTSEVGAAVHMHRVLSQHLSRQVPTHAVRQTEDHFTVTRVDPGALWLEPVSVGGGIIGPVAVPNNVSSLCRVGWDIGGVVARSFGGWKLLEIWSVST